MEIGDIKLMYGSKYVLLQAPLGVDSCTLCSFGSKDRCNDVCANKTGAYLVPYPQSSPYPKVMLVRHNKSMNWRERVVFMEKNDYYIAWGTATTLEDATKYTETCAWKHAKDIESEPVHTELTMQEIADKFGVDVNTLKIKK